MEKNSHIWAAIDGLSKSDLKQLYRVARTLLFRTSFRDPQELAHEALARALAGTRQWPSQAVPFMAFAVMAMKSIADASRKSPEQARTVTFDGFTAEGVSLSGSLWASATASPEDALIESECEAERQMQLEKLRRHFENDRQVRLLIESLANRKSSDDIRTELQCTRGEYEALRKRLRRAVVKLFRRGSRS